MIEVFNTWLPLLAASLWRDCWQGSLFILAACIASKVFRQLSPSLWSWIWWLACLKLLIGLCWTAPIAMPILPPRLAPDNIVQVEAAPHSVSVASSSIELDAARAPANTPLPPARFKPLTRASHISLPPSGGKASNRQAALVLDWLLAAWLGGIGCGFCRLFHRFRAARCLRAHARPIEDPIVWEQVRALASHLRLGCAPMVLEVEDLAGPVVIGPARPVILMPCQAIERLSPMERKMVLAHELAHIRRRDLWLSAVPTLAQVLFFFHPLAWLAARRWSAACEAACDARAVMAAGVSKAQYANLLVKMVTPGNLPGPLMALGASSGYDAMQWRLKMLEQISMIRRRPLVVAATVLVLLAAASVIPWRLAVRNSLQLDLPARIDPHTPRVQHGYMLLSLQVGGNGSYQFRTGGTVAWSRQNVSACLVVQPPRLPAPPEAAHRFSPQDARDFTATGHSSTGKIFPLNWSFEGTAAGRLMIVCLPAHLEDINPFIDMSISDRWGSHAHWRILGLPSLHRLVQPPVSLLTGKKVAGMTLTARAWQDQNAYPWDHSPLIRGEVKVTGAPSAPGEWLVSSRPMIPEWSFPIDPPQQQGLWLIRPGQDTIIPFQTDVYPQLSHYAALPVILRQIDTFHERLTFHHLEIRTENGLTYVQVKRPDLYVSSSGLTIILPAQGLHAPRKLITMSGSGDPPASRSSDATVSLRIHVTPGGDSFTEPEPYFFNAGSTSPSMVFNTLPGSPLFHKYHKPVAVQLSSPDTSGGMQVYWSRNSPATLDLQLPQRGPRYIPEFTVVIKHQVQVSSIPLTLIAPVARDRPFDLEQRPNFLPTGTTSAGTVTTGTTTGTTAGTATTGITIGGTTIGGTTIAGTTTGGFTGGPTVISTRGSGTTMSSTGGFATTTTGTTGFPMGTTTAVTTAGGSVLPH